MTHRFTIRPAEMADAAAACDVLRRSIVELCAADHAGDQQRLSDWLSNKTPEQVTHWIADPGQRVFVATDGAHISGVVAMTITGTVTLNYVAPTARFGGVS